MVPIYSRRVRSQRAADLSAGASMSFVREPLRIPDPVFLQLPTPASDDGWAIGHNDRVPSTDSSAIASLRCTAIDREFLFTGGARVNNRASERILAGQGSTADVSAGDKPRGEGGPARRGLLASAVASIRLDSSTALTAAGSIEGARMPR